MDDNSDLVKFLEMVKTSNPKAIKTSYGDTLKFSNGIDVEFDSTGKFTGFINNQDPYEKMSNVTGLLDKLASYFLNMFPKLAEEEIKNTEEIIEEGLILAKHIKSPLLEDDLWERLKNHFLDKYPHLESEHKSAILVITHALVLSEDERLKKNKKKVTK